MWTLMHVPYHVRSSSFFYYTVWAAAGTINSIPDRPSTCVASVKAVPSHTSKHTSIFPSFTLNIYQTLFKKKKKKALRLSHATAHRKRNMLKQQYFSSSLVSSTSPTLSAVCTDCKLLKPISESAVRLQKYTTLTST